MTRARFIVGLMALAVFALPFLPIFTGGNTDAVYQAIAADTYYYLKLASSVTEHGFPSFDGRTVSNGYMPLWQLIVVLLDIASGDTSGSPESMVYLTFLASFGFAAFGIVRLAMFVAGLYGLAAGLAFLPFLVPGAFFWFFQNVYWLDLDGGLNFGVHAWSFANGMESGICLAIFSLIVPRVHALAQAETPCRRDAFILGVFCFLALMGRLDDFFLGVACGGFLLLLSFRHRDFGLFAAFLLVPVAGSDIYMLGNLLASGSPFPSSGVAKLEIFSNSIVEAVRMVGNEQGVHFKFLTIAVSIFVGVFLVARRVFSQARGSTGLIEVLGVYLALKGGFLLLAVPLRFVGGWYFTDMVAALNLLFVLLIMQSRPKLLSQRALLMAIPLLAMATFSAARNTNFQLEYQRATSYTVVFRELCQNREKILTKLRAVADADGISEPRIIDTADGAYAFCLGLPALGLTGLGDSNEHLAERRRLSLFGAAELNNHVFVAGSNIRSASYPWRETALQLGYTSRLLFSEGSVEFWKIEPAR